MKTININDQIEKDGYTFKIIKKDGRVFLSEQTKNGNFVAFEAGWVGEDKGHPLGKDYGQLRENYPSSKLAGKTFFSIIGLKKEAQKRAEEKYQQLIKKIKGGEILSKRDNDGKMDRFSEFSLPSVNFTIKELQEFNKSNSYTLIYLFIKNRLEKKVIKIVGEKENLKGKPSKIYKKI